MRKQFDVLIVDDEQVVIDAVARICKANGMSSDAATDAMEALRKAEEIDYRLIICDIMMPDRDGFQFMESLKRRQVHPPVIMTTGYSTIEHAVRSLNSGAVGYLPKPFTEEELLSVLHRGFKCHELRISGIDRDLRIRASSSRDATGRTHCFHLGCISWARLDQSGSALIGVADAMLKTIDALEEMRLLRPGEEIVQGTPCAHLVVRSGLIHDVLGPISGNILDVNELLMGNVHTLEADPHGEGWLYRIVPADLGYELNLLAPCSFEMT
jgi:CheY-like chemotaxis protein/glycine cleavage system H lipoate-binding protein